MQNFYKSFNIYSNNPIENELFNALKSQYPDKIKNALNIHNQNPNCICLNGKPALFYALDIKKNFALELFLEKNADFFIKDNNNFNLIEYSCNHFVPLRVCYILDFLQKHNLLDKLITQTDKNYLLTYLKDINKNYEEVFYDKGFFDNYNQSDLLIHLAHNKSYYCLSLIKKIIEKNHKTIDNNTLIAATLNTTHQNPQVTSYIEEVLMQKNIEFKNNNCKNLKL